MSTTTEQKGPPTYGNWVRIQTTGFFGLGLAGSVAMFGCLLLFVLIIMGGHLLAAFVWLGLSVLALAPLAIRNRAQRNLWQILATKVQHWRGVRSGQNRYASHMIGMLAWGTHRLPGLLAESKLYEANDSYGRRFAMIHLPSTKHYTVLLNATPNGEELVDDKVIDQWVAHYGDYLARLGTEPGLYAATTTIEATPDPGGRLTSEVRRLLVDGTPQLSHDVLTEVAQSYPKGAPKLRGYVALTYSALRPKVDEKELFGHGDEDDDETEKESRVRTPEEMATLIGSRIPSMLAKLPLTGCTDVRPLTANDVCEIALTAYHPDKAKQLDEMRSRGEQPELSWDQAGPSGAHAPWGAYRHENAASVTWAMTKPNRSAVRSTVLKPLLGPIEGVTVKRLTLVYRPHLPADAQAVVDEDVRTAEGKMQKRGQATLTAELRAALKSADEESAGAGVTRVAMLLTATVVDDDTPAADGKVPSLKKRVRRAAEAVDQASSRIEFRRQYGSQDAAFAAALGVGVVLPAHVNVPNVIRDNL